MRNNTSTRIFINDATKKVKNKEEKTTTETIVSFDCC